MSQPRRLFLHVFRRQRLTRNIQALDRELRLDYCRRHGIEVARRATSGGAIYLDPGQLGFSLIIRQPEERRELALPQILELGSAAVAAGLRQLGIVAAVKSLNDIELAGRKIKIRVSDTRVMLIFQAGPDGFFACNNDEADLTLIAAAQDFLSLALRLEDPDTLFFSRRLVMEGDTELGLLLKNTFDAMDEQAFALKLPAPAQVLNALRLQFHAKKREL